jgi:hypothetical protein
LDGAQARQLARFLAYFKEYSSAVLEVYGQVEFVVWSLPTLARRITE